MYLVYLSDVPWVGFGTFHFIGGKNEVKVLGQTQT